MTRTTVNNVVPDQTDDEVPPTGTAIVRPLRYVRAVRERYLRGFTDPAETATSRAARAWAWALGETATAPVTDWVTMVPPRRADIEAEVKVADERRLRGDRDDRADAAATVLRWLIGDDDHVPLRGKSRGELVGGFGDVVRSRQQILDRLALTTQTKQRVSIQGLDDYADVRALSLQDADYLDGVIATLSWVLGQQTESPITRVHSSELTARALKAERVLAEDVIEQSRQPWKTDQLPRSYYGLGAKNTISWLLGDSTAPPTSS